MLCHLVWLCDTRSCSLVLLDPHSSYIIHMIHSYQTFFTLNISAVILFTCDIYRTSLRPARGIFLTCVEGLTMDDVVHCADFKAQRGRRDYDLWAL